MTERRATDEVDRILGLLAAYHEGIGRAYRGLLADLRGKQAGTSGSALADSLEAEQLSDSMPALTQHATPAVPAPRALLSPADLAARLGINPRTLRRLVHLGQVPAPILIGGAKRWDPVEFDAWLAGRTGGGVARGGRGRGQARIAMPARRGRAGGAP